MRLRRGHDDDLGQGWQLAAEDRLRQLRRSVEKRLTYQVEEVQQLPTPGIGMERTITRQIHRSGWLQPPRTLFQLVSKGLRP